MSPEQEDLDALLRSPGWARFVAYAAQEWGSDEGGGARYRAGAKAAIDGLDDVTALAKLRQVMVAQREIQRLFAWVGERVEHLKKTTPSPESDALPMSRRGGL